MEEVSLSISDVGVFNSYQTLIRALNQRENNQPVLATVVHVVFLGEDKNTEHATTVSMDTRIEPMFLLQQVIETLEEQLEEVKKHEDQPVTRH